MLSGFAIELATIAPMYEGTVLTGGVLLPGRVVHGPPQPDGGVPAGRLTVPAKPLNAEGAAPPVRTFSADHSAPHQVTVPDPAPATVPSPSTNAPRVGNANTIAVLLVSADGR